MPSTFIILAATAVLLAVLVFLYARLITARSHVDTAWHDLAQSLVTRRELVPALAARLESAPDAARNALRGVLAARADAAAAEGVTKQAAAEDALSSALARLQGALDADPALKGDSELGRLAADLVEKTERIASARRYYNTCVRDYNLQLQIFPTDVLARGLGLLHRDFFEVETRSRTAVTAGAKG